jgi:CRISPR/Cas system CMR subunit Cmr4 (Cas7 group RAMP superfamily)
METFPLIFSKTIKSVLREKLVNHCQKPVNQTEARKSHEEAQVSTGSS